MAGQPVKRARELAQKLDGTSGGERPGTTGEVDVTAWDSLLLECRRASYKVAWIDWMVEKLAEEQDRLESELEELDPGSEGYSGARVSLGATRIELKDWIKESRAERAHMVSVADKAIRAGLNSRLVSQVQLEQSTISRVLFAGLAVLDLDPMQQAAALNAMQQAVKAVALERRGDGVDAQALGAMAIGGRLLADGTYEVTGGPGAT